MNEDVDHLLKVPCEVGSILAFVFTDLLLRALVMSQRVWSLEVSKQHECGFISSTKSNMRSWYYFGVV